jgi:hypothetical protein
VLTDTDIPPGGEGKIEVTFDSSNKKGQQRKTITVESNDSRNPKVSLHVSALIEVEFGFQENSLNVGKLRKGQPFSRTATLLAKDQSLIKDIQFTSSSPYVTANPANTPAGGGAEKGRLTVEVTVGAEMPVGRINATITARTRNQPPAQASLQIMGAVIGNVDVTPESIHFYIDTSKNDSGPVKQVIKVVSTVDAARLRLIEIKDADQRLAFRVDTVLAGKEYEITVTPLPAALNAGQDVAGVVTIITDDKEQPVTSVTYGLIFAR